MKKSVLILFLILNVFVLNAQNRTTISGFVKDSNISSIMVKPIVNYPMPNYASGKVNEKGEYNIDVKINTPTLCEVIFIVGKKRVNGTWIYINVGNNIQVNYENGNFIFSNDCKKENEALKSLKGKIIFSSGVKFDDFQKEFRDTLKQLNCSPEYTKLLCDVIKFEGMRKEMSSLRSRDIVKYKSFMENIIKKGLRSPSICSVTDWPILLDDFFVECEKQQLFEMTDIRYENRLKWIEDPEVRSMYGVFLIDREINRKTWLKESINPMIDCLSKYITSNYSKEELNNALQRLVVSENKFAHLQGGKPAPLFTFESNEGKMVSLADYKGKFVILDIWNIYCTPCIAQIPYIKAMEKELEEKGVAFISISADPQDIKNKWKDFIKKREMVGTQLIMDSGRNSKFMTDYVIQGFPTFVLINPEGNIIDSSFEVPASQSFKTNLFKHMDNYQRKK